MMLTSALSALLLGFAGSLHCAGMCGPLVLALPVPVRTTSGFIAGRLVYHLGRMLSYCALGLVFGLIGSGVSLAGAQRWFSIVTGLLLIVGLVFSRKRLFALPVSKWVLALKSVMAVQLKNRSFTSSLVLGALNGLLPCGLVYIACAGAAASGGFPSSVGFMMLFGAGTLPMMLGISFAGRLVPTSLRLQFRKVAVVSVFLLGSLLILRGLGLGIPYLSPSSAGTCCVR